MQTQRDHVHAHQFLMGRMSNALVLGDPDTVENPFTRAVTGLLAGILIALLIVAGFGIYGWLVPGGSKAWRQKDAIIVEKETGAAYVYLNGALLPTMNMASARLIKGADARIQLTSRRSLKGVPRGNPIGIPGAPLVLPEPGRMLTGPWLACPDASGEKAGANLDPKAPADALADDKYVPVSAGGRDYLIWRGQRHPMADRAAPVALGLSTVTPIRVPQSWLGLLPEGEPLRAPRIDGAGQPGPAVAGRGHVIGTLFRQPVAGGTEQLFVLRREGLAPVNATQFRFLQAARAGRPVELTAADVVSAPRSANVSLTGGPPELAAARWEEPRGRVLCQRQEPVGVGAVAATVVFTGDVQAVRKSDGSPRVSVPSGSAMVAYPVPLPPGGRMPAPYLISEVGVRYPVPKDQALTAMGVNGVSRPMPGIVLASMENGPVLDRDAVIVAGMGG
ncbi:type VII secretion protein EccB [Couchioplanes caeruleus]|uniref:Type VII secretion protein EccB n=1 Tax=Couchioplanes caeruleus TaxID=56438 RepID=A0A3N1GHW9_9ACTN|nr:type VII secretion protein EccB [Couchioplanes caeruleus]ROP29854.1 type VII secretion protein EccB [Couchioplanes caeruleus]